MCSSCNTQIQSNAHCSTPHDLLRVTCCGLTFRVRLTRSRHGLELTEPRWLLASIIILRPELQSTSTNVHVYCLPRTSPPHQRQIDQFAWQQSSACSTEDNQHRCRRCRQRPHSLIVGRTHREQRAITTSQSTTASIWRTAAIRRPTCSSARTFRVAIRRTNTSWYRKSVRARTAMCTRWVDSLGVVALRLRLCAKVVDRSGNGDGRRAWMCMCVACSYLRRSNRTTANAQIKRSIGSRASFVCELDWWMWMNVWRLLRLRLLGSRLRLDALMRASQGHPDKRETNTQTYQYNIYMHTPLTLYIVYTSRMLELGSSSATGTGFVYFRCACVHVWKTCGMPCVYGCVCVCVCFCTYQHFGTRCWRRWRVCLCARNPCGLFAMWKPQTCNVAMIELTWRVCVCVWALEICRHSYVWTEYVSLFRTLCYGRMCGVLNFVVGQRWYGQWFAEFGLAPQ